MINWKNVKYHGKMLNLAQVRYQDFGLAFTHMIPGQVDLE